VENAVKWLALVLCGNENLFQPGTICELAFDEFRAGGEQIAPAVLQVIENGGFVTLGDEETGNGTTYIPGTSGNYYLHKNTVLSIALWGTVSLIQKAGLTRPSAMLSQIVERATPSSFMHTR
jgi:hypothetical protein